MSRTHVITDLWDKPTTLRYADWYLKTDANLEHAAHDKRQLEQFIGYVYGQERNKGIGVQHVAGQPYATADEMRLDYTNKRVLKISTDFNNPALVSPASNLEFRFAHDSHHSQTENCNFQLWGEVCAYSKFAAYTDNLWIRRWLFAEIVLQVCALIALGDFAEQKHLFAPIAWVQIADKAYNLPEAF